MKNILSIETVREAWNVAHNNMTGDVGRAALWMEVNHDAIIGFLLERIQSLEHKTAETAFKYGVPHDNDFTAE